MSKVIGPAKKIIDIERDKKQRIIAYLVEDLGWRSPSETIKGILSLEIDGVVAEKGGRTYIRTKRWKDLYSNKTRFNLSKQSRRQGQKVTLPTGRRVLHNVILQALAVSFTGFR